MSAHCLLGRVRAHRYFCFAAVPNSSSAASHALRISHRLARRRRWRVGIDMQLQPRRRAGARGPLAAAGGGGRRATTGGGTSRARRAADGAARRRQSERR